MGLVSAHLAKLEADLATKTRELNAVRAAWEAEHSQGGAEPEPALTCMTTN